MKNACGKRCCVSRYPFESTLVLRLWRLEEGVARDMIRISTIFIAICMVLVAASLGLILYSVAGISGTESAIVALTALTFLILYNAVSMRLRDRTDVGSQIADLSRGTADLARQVAEFGRRLAAVEGRVVSANSTGADRIQSVVNEIGELGGLVKQLAASVATHDDMLVALQANPAAAAPETTRLEPEPQKQADDDKRAATVPATVAHTMPSEPTPSRSQAQILATLRGAIERHALRVCWRRRRIITRTWPADIASRGEHQ